MIDMKPGSAGAASWFIAVRYHGRARAADIGARAAEIGGKAQEYAREAGRQASAAAQTAYTTGNDMLGVVEGVARENIWPALLIAGAIGYGLACIVKQR